MKKGQNRCHILLGVLAILLLHFNTTPGQEFRGTITGTVSDPQGAVVPAATVTVQNVETNVSSTVSTNEEGSFSFPLLLPGTYKLTSTAQNFQTTVRENIQVNVGDRLTIDLQLAIGTTTEVNVAAADEVLERGSVTTGTVITERQITELPLAEGAAYSLATQAPGVSYTGNPGLSGPTANGNLAAFRTNGAPGNQITLDGSPNAIFDGGVAYTPPADSLSQFKIQTNAFDAQNGFTAGSTVNVATKSGTNTLHGSAYIFARPEQFTANNFFNNRRGDERPERLYYRYGGQLNGPVRIPYLYNGKDRTFFMFSYEKQYNKRAEPEVFSVPTLQMRNGNFSELLALPQPILIYDPASAILGTMTSTNPGNGCTSGVVCRTPFAGNIIPANRINPAARAFLNLYPEPNQSGITANYFSNNITSQPYDSYLTRIDHNFNENHRIFGKFFYSKSTEDRYNFIGTPDAFTRGNEVRTNKGGNIDYTATISSTMVIDIRSSLNDFVQDRFPLNPVTLADLGFTALDAVSESTMAPRFNFTNYETLGPQRSDYNEGLTRDFRLFSLQPTITQIYGNHTLKYGYDYRRLMETRSTNNYNAGQFTFAGNFTNRASNANSGVDAFNQPGREIAAFLLGIPLSGSIDSTPASYDVTSNYHGFFIQDDWRVSPKLTLNLGLRYELESGLREANGQIVTGFDTTTENPLQAAARARYATNVNGTPATTLPVPGLTADQFNVRGGLLFAGGDGDVNQATDKNNFQPRIGVSYALDDKTVLRGGFGIFSSPFQIQAVNQTGFTALTTFAASTNNGLTFPATLNNPFAALNSVDAATLGLTTFLGNTLGTTNASGPTVTGVLPYERKNANYARFVAGIQREVFGGVAVEATFVASRGYDLPVLRQLNYVPRQYLNNLEGVTDFSTIATPNTGALATATAFLGASVTNPFRGLVPSNPTLNSNTIARRFLLTQYPQFQDLITTEYNGSSDYKSLQLQANKRFSEQGLSLNASYTYAHDREKTRRLNPQDEELTSMISTFSRPHRVTFSGSYEIPFGRGRLYFSDINPVVDAIFGGWQLNAVYEWQSGEPLVFGNVYYNGDPTKLKNRLGQRDEQGRKYGIDIPAFDTEGFILVNPTTGARTIPGFGNNYTVSGQNTLRYFPYTLNNLRNQPFQKFDAGLTKNFRIREKMNLQIRFEAINALNRVYFSGLQLGPSNANATGTDATLSSFTFGKATTQRNLPRDIQFGARFTF